MKKIELERLKEVGGYYFGCIDVAGHYVFKGNNQKEYNSEFVAWLPRLDGMLAPRFTREEGKALLHHFDGFTILAFWNYSVDKRGGSNSMFVFPGKLDFDQMISSAHGRFSKLMNSFEFKIELANLEAEPENPDIDQFYIHVSGPDEVHGPFSEKNAHRQANESNKQWLKIRAKDNDGETPLHVSTVFAKN